MVRPDFSDSMSPASCSTAKWADMVGFDTGKWSDSSPADIGRSRNSCRTRRRVGSESALNTLFTDLYLANYLNIVKGERPDTPSPVSNEDHERTMGSRGGACRNPGVTGLLPTRDRL